MQAQLAEVEPDPEVQRVRDAIERRLADPSRREAFLDQLALYVAAAASGCVLKGWFLD